MIGEIGRITCPNTCPSTGTAKDGAGKAGANTDIAVVGTVAATGVVAEDSAREAAVSVVR